MVVIFKAVYRPDRLGGGEPVSKSHSYYCITSRVRTYGGRPDLHVGRFLNHSKMAFEVSKNLDPKFYMLRIMYSTNLKNSQLEIPRILGYRKIQNSNILSSEQCTDSILKFCQILSFLLSPEYKVFGIEILCVAILHYYLHLDFFCEKSTPRFVVRNF